MLFTNPLVKRVVVYSELAGDVVVNEDGVKLGEVAAYVAEIVGRHNSKGGGWEGRSRHAIIEQMSYKGNRRLVGWFNSFLGLWKN
jgi:hypothetical protein